MSAVGIPVLQGGEDVKLGVLTDGTGGYILSVLIN